MEVQTQRLSIGEFEAFVRLPENDDHYFEWFSGDVLERLPRSNYLSAMNVRALHLVYQSSMRTASTRPDGSRRRAAAM